MLVWACGEAPEYRVGLELNEVQFEFFDLSEGIYPSTVVLNNPNNPFAEFSIGAVTKFAIQDGANNAAAFYAWATVLANEPIGENQFFAATSLRDIYLSDGLDSADRQRVREMAIAGFQSVLNNFPASRLFDATGTQSFRLATPAYQEIVALNGTPEGDWVLVVDEGGNPVAVRSTEIPRELD